jgi:hypothetical protein
MRRRFALGMILAFVSWVPFMIWQSSVDWGPAVLGEATYQRIMSTHVVQVAAVAASVGIFLTALSILLRPVFGAWKGIRDQAKIRAVGVPAQAVVRSIGESSQGTVTVNTQPLLALTLEINDGYGAPYAVSFETIVPRYALPRVQPGDTIPVKIDPNDRQRVAVDWGAMGY